MQKRATDLTLKFREHLDVVELSYETESFKMRAEINLRMLERYLTRYVYKFTNLRMLIPACLNVQIALKIFLCFPVNVKFCERSIGK